MYKTMISGWLIFLLLFTGCKKDAVDKLGELTNQDLTDLKYGQHPDQLLDVFLPETRSPQTPILIFIHGGFWLGGDKSELTDLAKSFRNKGYASVVINYRLSHTIENNIHPAQVNDVSEAIEYVRNNASEWQISPDDLGLLGASAGGHLALLYAYAYDSNKIVKSVISLAGPTNLENMQNASLQQAQVVQWFLGTNAQSPSQTYQQASPVNHVTANSPPTLLLHGKLDVIVPYDQSQQLKTKLDALGVKNKLVTYENLGHQIDPASVPGLIAECEAWLSENP